MMVSLRMPDARTILLTGLRTEGGRRVVSEEVRVKAMGPGGGNLLEGERGQCDCDSNCDCDSYCDCDSNCDCDCDSNCDCDRIVECVVLTFVEEVCDDLLLVLPVKLHLLQ